jgi:hypothetical protein
MPYHAPVFLRDPTASLDPLSDLPGAVSAHRPEPTDPPFEPDPPPDPAREPGEPPGPPIGDPPPGPNGVPHISRGTVPRILS